MSLGLLVAFSSFLLKYNNFISPYMVQHFAYYLGTHNSRGTYDHVITIFYKQNLIKSDRRPFLYIELGSVQLLILSNLKLFSSDLYDYIHKLKGSFIETGFIK